MREKAIPALTVHQPYASLFFVEGDRAKDVENRFWRPAYRGPLFIHAGRQIDRQACRDYADLLGDQPFPSGAIIGVVRLVDVVRNSDSEWADRNMWHWRFIDRVLLPEPIPSRGNQKLWWPDEKVRELLRGQLQDLANGAYPDIAGAL